MTTLAFIFIILSIIHVVYESIIAPSLRLNLRYRLFEIRDKIRLLKIDNQEKFDTKLFNLIDDSINSKINFLSGYNISLLIKVVKKLNDNPEIQEEIKKIQASIDSCPVKEVKLIHEKTSEIIILAIAINMGMWIFYLLPFLLIAYFISALKKLIVTPCKNYIKKASLISEQAYFPQYVPERHHSTLLYH